MSKDIGTSPTGHGEGPPSDTYRCSIMVDPAAWVLGRSAGQCDCRCEARSVLYRHERLLSFVVDRHAENVLGVVLPFGERCRAAAGQVELAEGVEGRAE